MITGSNNLCNLMIYDEKTQLIFPFASIINHNTFKIFLILSIKGVLPNPCHIQPSHVNIVTNRPCGSKRMKLFTIEEQKGILSNNHSTKVKGIRLTTMPFLGLLFTPCTMFFYLIVHCVSRSCKIVSCAS